MISIIVPGADEAVGVCILVAIRRGQESPVLPVPGRGALRRHIIAATDGAQHPVSQQLDIDARFSG